MASRRVTINDVARHLGIAKGTVSRALNGYADVSPALKRRVMAAADELDYKPSSLARRLTNGRADTVGIVLIVGEPNLYDAFLSEFLDGASRTLKARGRDLLVSTAPCADAAVSEYASLAQLRKADGFLLTRTETDDPRVRFLKQKEIPFVAYGRVGGDNDHPWLDVDGEAAMADAVARLAKLGHRRIGMVGAPDRLNFARLRRQGFCRGLAAAGLGHEDLLVETAGAIDIEAGRIAAMKLLQKPAPPTALICMNDVFAFGAYAAARDAGLRIGSDLSVISYDGLPTGDFLDPPLTTYDQSSVKSGVVVADMLLDLIDGIGLELPGRLEKATLRERGSHGPPTLSSEMLAKLITQTAAEND